MKSARHCSFDGTDCWYVKTHPKIDSISQSEGYKSGGQTLTIEGHGLNGTDISVTVDGVACEVTHSESKFINCVTNAKQTVS
jgi:hypothetical protein